MKAKSLKSNPNNKITVLTRVDLEEIIPGLDQLATLSIGDVPTGWTVIVTTENSRYEITILDPGQAKVSVKGGYFDRKKKSQVVTTLTGSTFGGSSVVQNMIVEGLFMEFGNLVTTSKVKDFKLISPSGSAEV